MRLAIPVTANPRGPFDAIRWAIQESMKESRSWDNWCLKFVANCYGFDGSGYGTAKSFWDAIPASYKSTSWPPPAGAIVFWDVPNLSADHVAMTVDDAGNVVTNDVITQGKVDIIPISTVNTRWRASYKGWARPFFNRGWGRCPYTHVIPKVPAYPGRARFEIGQSGPHIKVIQCGLYRAQTGVMSAGDYNAVALYQSTRPALFPADGSTGPITYSQIAAIAQSRGYYIV